ncbi:uncharacterized protein N7515_005277 [Penicillium bovifimosum]|uniref:F-box domain-containing protein n=1 Tax=Penicillium bovifimosum TaxID=126998 RepID=A0A9W9GST9_9EURO|nr:uncharacterized protein N7515_005277 [Penicillium bovifimosum]KAJ5129238.1 hypothetical protein N7515_005277 [Penicillium bovifimosum]
MAPPPMATPAQSQAFSIPEIFELILLNLDTRTLLTKASRVCRDWTRFINSSPPIQRALFFKPLGNVLNKPTMENPMLAEAFPSLFHQIPATGDDDTNHNGRTERLLPLVTFTTFDFIRRPHMLDAYMRPEASWRRMLVQQPAVHTLTFLRVNYGHGGQSLCHYEVWSADYQKELGGGLRMETLFEVLIFEESWTQFECPNTRVFWRLEDLGESTQREMQLHGVGDLGLVLRTDFGVCWQRDSSEAAPEHDAVKNVRKKYRELGMTPKYWKESWVLERKTWGSLWN